ncbi:TIGR02302 family protein [Minwuia thermotolerans]|uniref:TIGR02302 family protein n=1 Tax=Minwuia thermotolerans TaxID=2056226 RepID=A0A2M9G606_9PROT|nr:TIGR02302 family protein [Minwuia thermotolerans]PJK31147.1 TIGR02302 family protein [Minwuia thermotolerans]
MSPADRPTAHDILDADARRRLRRKRLLTRTSLILERLTPLLWAPAALLCVGLAATAAGLWSALPGYLHLALIGLWLLAVAGLGVRSLILFHPPSAAEVTRRLEGEGVSHRPLTAVGDRMALGGRDPAAAGLWEAHRRRMAERIDALTVPAPKPDTARRDPYALRFAAVLLLVLGVAASGQRFGDNLQAALEPGFAPAGTEPAVMEAWITPPAYTGHPPMFISAMAGAETRTLQVPVNSRLLARYHGSGLPEMRQGETVRAFEAVSERDAQFETELTSGGPLGIENDGEVLGRWMIEIIPDAPPAVEITKDIETSLRGAMRIGYHATDDYGLTSISAHIRRADGEGEELVLDLPLPGRGQRSIEDVVFRDLTAHRWAGLPVTFHLRARDQAGQTADSGVLEMTLPARQFSQPAARAVIEQRRKLIVDADAHREWVVRAISALQINPGVYDDDLAAHLMLSLARAELAESGAPGVLSDNEELLWRTALRIEEGQISVALKKLRDIQQKLQEALASGASEEEIQRLMDELQQAMDEYLQALQQQAMEQMQRGEELPEMQDGETMDQRDLADILDRARELSRSGARDQARDMLSQLQEMLENLQMGKRPQSAQGQQEGAQMLDELGRMMQRQQELMDETYKRQQRRNQPNSRLPTQRNPFTPPGRQGRQGQQGERGEPRQGQGGQPGDGDLAQQQEALRRQLGELMRRLGEGMGRIPDELGQAEQSMRGAEGSLGQGDRDGALDRQDQALDQLRRGTESVLEDMANRGENEGQSDQGAGQAGIDGEDTDPLGRTPAESWGDTSGDMVPDKGALQRSREILDELRKRSGQRHRSENELDYLDRLLRQF